LQKKDSTKKSAPNYSRSWFFRVRMVFHRLPIKAWGLGEYDNNSLLPIKKLPPLFLEVVYHLYFIFECKQNKKYKPSNYFLWQPGKRKTVIRRKLYLLYNRLPYPILLLKSELPISFINGNLFRFLVIWYFWRWKV